MTCKTCGFAASDPTITVCPQCSAAPSTAIWPPAPTAEVFSPDYGDMALLAKQRQNGILMAILPMAAVYGVSLMRGSLPEPYGSGVLIAVIVAGIYPHFRGCAHWAESKGYPRYEGRLLGILSWLGVIFLAIRRDKTRVLA